MTTIGPGITRQNAVALQGVPISTTLPTDTQVLKYVAATNLWTPSTDAAGTGTVTSIVQGTGMSFSVTPITTTGTINLANTAVTPATYTYPSITVDQQGRITAASSLSGAGRLLAIQRFATHQTVTPTYNASTTSIIIKLVGAGGGGRSVGAPSASNVSVGQPGGGGAYLEKRLTTGFSGKVLIVGTGGAGGSATSPPNSGANGTATSFDAGGANYSAGGGGGGTSDNVAPYGWIVWHSNGGTASNGDLNVAGGVGYNFSVAASGNPSAVSVGGPPGAPQYGQGGVANSVVATTVVAGGNGSGNGSGGSGAIAYNGNTPAAGGNGTDGYAEIWEYS